VDTQNSVGGRSRGWIRALTLGALGVVLLGFAGVWPTEHSESRGKEVSVVVASRALQVGSLLGAADLRMAAMPTPPGDDWVLRQLDEARGRRLLIGVPSGVPLGRSMLSGAAEVEPGRRSLRVVVDANHLDPGLRPGSNADVLVAVDAAGASGAPGSVDRARVLAIAVARVIAVEPAGAAAGAGRGADGAVDRDHTQGVSAVVTLDCDAVSGVRMIWAESYARSIRIVARPAGELGSLGEVDVAHLVGSR
jgi:Flp pilus assembly protein CpaB